MKNILLALLLLCLPMAPLGTTGMSCKPSQQRVVYNSLYTTALTVNSAYSAYNDAVVSGKATFSVSVAQKYNEFQAALNVALAAAQNNSAAITPQSLADVANQVLGLIKQFTK